MSRPAPAHGSDPVPEPGPPPAPPLLAPPSAADEAEALGRSLLALASRLRDERAPDLPLKNAPAPSGPVAALLSSASVPADRLGAGRVPDPGALSRTVAGLQALRQRRLQHLGLALAGDAARDILVSLYEVRLHRRDLTFYQLCATGSGYPATIRRWLAVLTAQGLVELHGPAGESSSQRARLTRKGELVMTDCLRGLLPPP